MITFARNYLGYIIGLVIISIIISGIIICGGNLSSWEKYGGAIAGLASLLSIYFLYETLTQQGNSFKQERFEITFFNLLDQRQKAVRSLSFKCEELKGEDFILATYHGAECFDAVCREMNCLKESLYGKKYLGMMTDEDIPSAMQELAMEPCVDEMIRNVQKRCYCKRANYTYGITKANFEAAKQDQTEKSKNIRCFNLLISRGFLDCECYFRLLKLICSILTEAEELKYSKILLAQMSVSELKLLRYQSLVDEMFCKQIFLSQVDKELKSQGI